MTVNEFKNLINTVKPEDLDKDINFMFRGYGKLMDLQGISIKTEAAGIIFNIDCPMDVKFLTLRSHEVVDGVIDGLRKLVEGE